MPGSAIRQSLSAALAAAVFVALSFGVALAWERSGEQITDITLYRSYGERIAAGQVPYRDFRFEYPPGSLPALVAPALPTSSWVPYRLVFGGLMALAGGAGILIVARVRKRLGYPARETYGVLAALALAPVALGALLLDRFDLLPALVTLLALLAFVHDRHRLGACVLGLAIAVKLYPAVILPLAVARTWRHVGRRDGLLVAACALGVASAVYIPFAVVAPDGVASSIGRQLGRPLQIESLGAGVLLATHQLTGLELDWSSGNGSQNLTGGQAVAVAALLSVVQIGALGWIWVRFARSPASTERFVVAATASVAAFVALGKVLSPQFLVWLLLLVPLATGRLLRWAGALYVLACGLTALWFPAHYWELVREFDPFASWLVLSRDLVLVALVVVLAKVGTRRPPRSSFPDSASATVAAEPRTFRARGGAGARSPSHVP